MKRAASTCSAPPSSTGSRGTARCRCKADGSFAAVVPGNVPFHIQLIDKFGLSMANESIWISGRAGEQRFCGGCHESRTKAATLAPGIPPTC